MNDEDKMLLGFMALVLVMARIWVTERIDAATNKLWEWMAK